MARAPGSAGVNRAFKNDFEEYKGDGLHNYISKDDRLEKKYRDPLLKGIGKLQVLLSRNLEDGEDRSVYTGSAGQALLSLQLYLKLPERDVSYLHDALNWLKHAITASKTKSSRISFLCGDAGPSAIAAVVYHYMGDKRNSLKYVGQVECQFEKCEGKETPDEILYGRCGYLSALLFIQHHLGHDVVNHQSIIEVVLQILSSGERLAKKQHCTYPLMYEWHSKPYLGAAHGLVGIYYILLQVQEHSIKERVRELVKPGLDFLLTQRYTSGNGKSSLGEIGGDKLVHWCHGAPGWVQLYRLAHDIYVEKRYLEAAKDCGKVVWQRGLLRKGYGLCHGAAGNGYTFISLWKLTGDCRYLHFALKFAEWCCDFGTHGCHTPDRPWSLFEGLAGTVYFLADLLVPGKAAFPGYDILQHTE